jgi:hypothetical protein
VEISHEEYVRIESRIGSELQDPFRKSSENGAINFLERASGIHFPITSSADLASTITATHAVIKRSEYL